MSDGEKWGPGEKAQVPRWDLVCDACGRRVTTPDLPESLPEGWSREPDHVLMHGRHRCPGCVAEGRRLSENEKWGAGDKANWRYLKHGAHLGTTPVRLFHGEHPHSRSDNDLYAELAGGDAVGFDGHRVRIGVSIEEMNYLKSSGLSGDQVRKDCTARLYMDDVLVYGKHFRQAKQALLWYAQALSDGTFFEHPVCLWEHEGDPHKPFSDLIGRKVYWRDVPAIVTRYFPDQGNVVAEAEKGHEFLRPAYRSLQDCEERETMMKDDFLSKDWWWFRETGDRRVDGGGPRP